jgi:hypothetical protein
LQGKDLRVLLQNHTQHDASVLLNVTVNSPTAHSAGQVGQLTVRAGEERADVIPASRLEGFDVTGSEWLRADLRYDFTLDDGAHGQRHTAVALQRGAVVPRAEAIQRGLQLPDSVLENDPVQDKAAVAHTTQALSTTTFRVCFVNDMTFRVEGNTGPFSDTTSAPNLAGDPATPWKLPIPGQRFFDPANVLIGGISTQTGARVPWRAATPVAARPGPSGCS